jgi:hypothetical protein
MLDNSRQIAPFFLGSLTRKYTEKRSREITGNAPDVPGKKEFLCTDIVSGTPKNQTLLPELKKCDKYHRNVEVV